jgi:hypothetical protein
MTFDNVLVLPWNGRSAAVYSALVEGCRAVFVADDSPDANQDFRRLLFDLGLALRRLDEAAHYAHPCYPFGNPVIAPSAKGSRDSSDFVLWSWPDSTIIVWAGHCKSVGSFPASAPPTRNSPVEDRLQSIEKDLSEVLGHLRRLDDQRGASRG